MPEPSVIYEVTLAIDPEIADIYADWLGPHIEEILSLPGFISADWWGVEPDDESRQSGESVCWCVQYRVASREALQAYFDEHAARLRGDGLARFSGRFEATRRILHLRESQG